MTLHLKAETEDAGTRLDAFVASRANGLTRSQAARYIEEGRVSVDGKPAALTYKEFELLKYLFENKGMVLTRDQILQHIWGYDFDGETRTVDVHVRTLRQKLGEKGDLIQTVRGVGYRVGGE